MTNLDKFLNGYVASALWSSDLDNYDIDDLAPVTRARMTEDATKFMADNANIINAENNGFPPHGKFAQAGHDFWLTRTGHGAGFWDGDWPISGEVLTRSSEAFQALYLYIGDNGSIYSEDA